MKILTVLQRRGLISLHILFVVALLGHAIDTLVIYLQTLSAVSGESLLAGYEYMHLLGSRVGAISAMGALITGVLLSVLANWGLFKHYWIILKDILTLIVIFVGALGINIWDSQAISFISTEGINALHNPVFLSISQKLFTALIFQIAVLTFMIILSVFKPKGQRVGRR